MRITFTVLFLSLLFAADKADDIFDSEAKLKTEVAGGAGGEGPAWHPKLGVLSSGNAHIITPYNVTVDKVTERFLGKRKIGTTGRGIGPTYADKINRVGIRVQDLYDESILTQKVEAALDVKNQILTKLYNRRAISVAQVVEELLAYADKLAPYVADHAPHGCTAGAPVPSRFFSSPVGRRRSSPRANPFRGDFLIACFMRIVMSPMPLAWPNAVKIRRSPMPSSAPRKK